jgi:MFS family permease
VPRIAHLERGHVRRALRHAGFRRLYAVRLAGQFGDGVFQASLAGAVLFSPEHQAKASQVAAGFAVILLPYSFIGPFAGVLLDRWWRQRVLVIANLVRAVAVLGVAAEIAGGLRGEPFYASALVVVSVNRFVLSGLSTGLPHVVDEAELVTANALSTTSGAIATAAGGGGAILLRLPIHGNASYAWMAMAATVPYVAASMFARGFARNALGPDDAERAARETLRVVAAGLVAGARHIRERKPALRALAMIGAQRFCYGIATICILLLYRNYFHDHGFFRAGIAGLGQVIAMAAIGSGLAAVVTPAATRRMGFVNWPVILLVLSAVTEIAGGLPFTMPLLLVAAGIFGFSAQGIKICVDTTVQRAVQDDFRGRVFSLYDTMFNLAFVGAAVLTALVLPDNGHSPPSVLVLGLAYAVIAAVYVRTGREPHA